MVKLWREDLAKINAKAAESLADPAQYPNLFPNLDLALHAEAYQVRATISTPSGPFAFPAPLFEQAMRWRVQDHG